MVYDLEKQKAYDAEYYQKNKEKRKEQVKHYDENNKEKKQEQQRKRLEDRKQHAVDSMKLCEIIDQKKWDLWCDEIKRKDTKHPYSDDFTNDVVFEIMVQGCFYCGDIATTVDRIDSKLGHTIDNCVGCCYGCNMSKGTADPSTFVRKAYYRVHDKYYDDDNDIWFIHKTKPRIWQYKNRANRKGVSFDITKEYFDILVKGDCAYCQRSPTTWFGIDRVIPAKGYVLTNVVSCCFDCNLDKLEDDIDTMIARNDRIVNRVVSGKLCIDDRVKVILHTDKSL